MSAGPGAVGFVSPLPPVRSGIADYSADLLGPLRERLEVVTYEPADAAKALRAGHAAVVCQVGNDPLHLPTVEAMRERAGRSPVVLVLHDYSIHHLFAAGYLDRGRVDDYARELERAHGARGRVLGQRAREGARNPVWDLAPWEWPLSGGVVSDADAVIVHSRLVRGALLRDRPGAWVNEVPHLVPPSPRTPRPEARQALGLPPDRVIAASLGVVTPAKRIGKLIEALALLPASRRPFLLVGGAVGSDDPLVASVARLGLGEDVVFTGYLSDADFWLAASAADVAVNLRFPTVGETSGAVCRLAGNGLPVLVSDVGWFRELPDSFAAKVPVGDGEVEAAAAALEKLLDPDERGRQASAAVRWGRERSPERIADAYARVIREVSAGAARPLGLLGRVSHALWELGTARAGAWGTAERGPDGELACEAAARLSGLLPSPPAAYREGEGSSTGAG